jgi:hypothetical protein
MSDDRPYCTFANHFHPDKVSPEPNDCDSQQEALTVHTRQPRENPACRPPPIDELGFGSYSMGAHSSQEKQ